MVKRVSGLGRHYLSERPGRAALVSISVALGVTVVVAVGAGIATLDRGVNRLGRGLGRADVVASSAGAFGSRLSPADQAAIAGEDGIEKAAPVAADTRAVSAEGNPIDAELSTLLAVPLDRVDFLVEQTASGRIPRTAGEIDISSRVAERLHLHIGDRAVIGTSTYRVVGVLAPGMGDIT